MHYLRTLLMTWKTGLCLIKPLKGRSVQACPFRKFHPSGIRTVRQNHRIIRVDALEGAKLSHGETVSGKAKGRPLQEGWWSPGKECRRSSVRPAVTERGETRDWSKNSPSDHGPENSLG